MKKDTQLDGKIASFLKRKTTQYPELDYIARQLARNE